MLDGEPLGVVAEDEEVRGILGLHVAHQHPVHFGHLRPGPQLLGDRLLHTAQGNIHRV